MDSFLSISHSSINHSKGFNFIYRFVINFSININMFCCLRYFLPDSLKNHLKQPTHFIHSFIHSFCVCVCLFMYDMYIHAHVPWCLWMSEDNFPELVFSCSLKGSDDGTQVIRFTCKHLYTPHCFASPVDCFK